MLESQQLLPGDRYVKGVPVVSPLCEQNDVLLRLVKPAIVPIAGTSSCCLAWYGHRPTCWTHNLTIRTEYPPRGYLVPTAMTEARCLQSSGELMHGTICAAMLTTIYTCGLQSTGAHYAD